MPNQTDNEKGNRNWLPQLVKWGRATAEGDVIAADVGERAQGVAVGKYIVQIGSLKIPMWAILLSLVFLAATVVVSVYDFTRNRSSENSQSEQMDMLFDQVSATETPTPMPKMTGSFNVAVAEFSTQGEGDGLEGAQRLVQDFANAIELNMDELGGGERKFDFRPPREIGSIPGADSVERATNARTLADKIGADIVIYGVVEVHGVRATIRPEFYINDSVNDGLVEAWEITGQYEMGSPLPVERVVNDGLRSEAADTLLARFRSLKSIIDGLAAYVIGRYEVAEERFAEATQQGTWNNREVLYVMLGNARIEQDSFQKAEDYYRQALGENDHYSRAYIGLANVLYEQARSSGSGSGYKGVDSALLDQSVQMYEEALQPHMDRPPMAEIEAKANFGLGQAHLLHALVAAEAGDNEGASDLLGQSKNAFQDVIGEYERANNQERTRLEERAAHSYARLGLIYRLTNDTAGAQAAYMKTISMLPDLERTRLDRSRYEAALGDMYAKQNDLQSAANWYKLAVSHAPPGSAESAYYQERLNTTQIAGDETN